MEPLNSMELYLESIINQQRQTKPAKIKIWDSNTKLQLNEAAK